MQNDGKVSTRVTKQNDYGKRHTRRQFSFILILSKIYTLYSTGFIQRSVLSLALPPKRGVGKEALIKFVVCMLRRIAHAIIIHAWLGKSVGEEEESSLAMHVSSSEIRFLDLLSFHFSVFFVSLTSLAVVVQVVSKTK